MKVRKKSIFLIFGALAMMLVLAFVFACSCNGSNPLDLRFSVSPTSVSLEVGENTTLTLTRGADVEGVVEWISSDPTTATVNPLNDAASLARVDAIGEGSARIFARIGTEFVAEVTVTVTFDDEGSTPEPVFITAVSDTEQQLLTGLLVTLQVATEIPLISWSSQDTSVATVVALPTHGFASVLGLEEGSTTIIASVSTPLGLRDVRFTVAVVDPVLTLSPITTQPLVRGETYQLDFVSTPVLASFTSDDFNVVTVDENGYITAEGAGSTIIRADISGLFPNVYTTVTVVNETVRIDFEHSHFDFEFGSPPRPVNFEITHVFFNETTGTVQRDIITDPLALTWESTDSDVATVTPEGMVTPVAHGTATITGTFTAQGDVQYSASLTVSVAEIPDNAILLGTREEFLDIFQRTSWVDITEDHDGVHPVTGAGSLAAHHELIASSHIIFTNDIDLAGVTFGTGPYGSSADVFRPVFWLSWDFVFSGILDGNGYRLTIDRARFLFNAGTPFAGTIRNFNVTMTVAGADGLFIGDRGGGGTQVFDGTIINSFFDLTYEEPAAQTRVAAISMNAGMNAEVRDTIFVLRNVVNFQSDGLFGNTPFIAPTLQNVFIHTYGAFVHPFVQRPEVRLINATQMLLASTFEALDSSVWNIQDGAWPILRNPNDVYIEIEIDTVVPAIELNGRLQLAATLTDSRDGSVDNSPVIWRSENPSIATVSANGEVTGLLAGTVRIFAQSARSRQSDYITITVLPPLGVVGVSRALFVGEEYTVPLLNARGNIIWGSLNPDIATIDDSGIVTGVARGVAVLTATSSVDPSIIIWFEVTVDPVELLVPAELTLSPDMAHEIAVSLNRGGLDIEVIEGEDYLAFDPVFENGILTVVIAEGVVNSSEIVIELTTITDGQEISRTITITIYYPAPVEIHLSHTAVDLDVGDTLQIFATVTNFDEEVTWESSDAAVTVENGLITAGSTGTATITVTAGSVSATIEVTVTLQPVTVVIFDGDQYLRIGQDRGLSYRVSRGDYSWSSSDSSIVSVENGRIVGVAAGVATITLTSNRDNSSYSIEVTVRSVTITNSNHLAIADGILAGSTFQLEYLTTPAGFSVVWTTSDAGIATIDENGLITTYREGMVTVRASLTLDPLVYYEFDLEVLFNRFAGFTPISTAEQFIAMTTTGRYFLVNDIIITEALAGTDTVGSAGGASGWQGAGVEGGFNGTLDGNGFAVRVDHRRSIFWTSGPNARIRNISIIGTFTRSIFNNNEAASESTGTNVFSGSIENSFFDITFGTTEVAFGGGRSAIGVIGATGSVVRDSIFILRNAATLAGNGLFRESNGTIENVFVHVVNASPPAEGDWDCVEFLSDAQLRQASTFSAFDQNRWFIFDGLIPSLRNSLDAFLVFEGIPQDIPSILEIGQSVDLSDVSVSDGSPVVWSSSNTNIATVIAAGVISFVGAGEVTITATIARNGIARGFNFTVLPPLALVQSSITLERGETFQIELVGRDSEHVTFTAENTTVSVDDNGLVTAEVAASTATVTVESTLTPGYTVTFSVTVRVLAEVSLVEDTADVVPNVDFTINPGFTRDDDTARFVVVSGGEFLAESVADGTLLATGRSLQVIAGNHDDEQIVIRIESVINPSSYAVFTLTIDTDAAIAVRVDRDAVSLYADIAVGDSTTIIATVDNTENRAVTWSSDNDSIATVENGVITATPTSTGGTATITVASVADTTATATVTVTVTPVPITLTVCRNRIYLPVGGQDLAIPVANRGGWEWSGHTGSSVADIRFNEANEAIIDAAAVGELVITVTAERDVSVTQEITIIVVEIVFENRDALTEGELFAGVPIDILAVVSPIAEMQLVWSSSNNAVATVTQDGVVTGHATGTVTIRAALYLNSNIYTEISLEFTFRSLLTQDMADRQFRQTGGGYVGMGTAGGNETRLHFGTFRFAADGESIETGLLSTAAHREIQDSDFVVDYLLINFYERAFDVNTLTHSEPVLRGQRRLYWQFARDTSGNIVEGFTGWTVSSAANEAISIDPVSGAITGTGFVEQALGSHLDRWWSASAFLTRGMGAAFGGATSSDLYFITATIIPKAAANLTPSPEGVPFANNLTQDPPPVWGGALHPDQAAVNTFNEVAGRIAADLSNIIYTTAANGNASLQLILDAETAYEAITTPAQQAAVASMRTRLDNAITRFNSLEQDRANAFIGLVDAIGITDPETDINEGNFAEVENYANEALVYYNVNLILRTQQLTNVAASRLHLQAILDALAEFGDFTALESVFINMVGLVGFDEEVAAGALTQYNISFAWPGYSTTGQDSWPAIANAIAARVNLIEAEGAIDYSSHADVQAANGLLDRIIETYEAIHLRNRTQLGPTDMATNGADLFLINAGGTVVALRGAFLGATWLTGERATHVRGFRIYVFPDGTPNATGVNAEDAAGHFYLVNPAKFPGWVTHSNLMAVNSDFFNADGSRNIEYPSARAYEIGGGLGNAHAGGIQTNANFRNILIHAGVWDGDLRFAGRIVAEPSRALEFAGRYTDSVLSRLDNGATAYALRGSPHLPPEHIRIANSVASTIAFIPTIPRFARVGEDLVFTLLLTPSAIVNEAPTATVNGETIAGAFTGTLEDLQENPGGATITFTIPAAQVTEGATLTITAISGITEVAGPMQISTAQDFITFMSLFPTGSFVLTDDIDFSSTPAFNGLPSFNGVFDGRGHSITITLNGTVPGPGTAGTGLFGQLQTSGVIRNTEFIMTVTSGGDFAGAVTRHNQGLIENNIIRVNTSIAMSGIAGGYSNGRINNNLIILEGTTEAVRNGVGIFARHRIQGTADQNFVVTDGINPNTAPSEWTSEEGWRFVAATWGGAVGSRVTNTTFFTLSEAGAGSVDFSNLDLEIWHIPATGLPTLIRE